MKDILDRKAEWCYSRPEKLPEPTVGQWDFFVCSVLCDSSQGLGNWRAMPCLNRFAKNVRHECTPRRTVNVGQGGPAPGTSKGALLRCWMTVRDRMCPRGCALLMLGSAGRTQSTSQKANMFCRIWADTRSFQSLCLFSFRV